VLGLLIFLFFPTTPEIITIIITLLIFKVLYNLVPRA